MFHNKSNILDLPFEIKEEIISRLPYTDVQSVRMTCSAFNDVGKYVQMRALHKMKRMVGSALEMWGGKNCVKCLAGIIRVADASTYRLVLDDSLPPVPCALLSEMEEALSLVTRRIPDRLERILSDRLKRIFTGFDRYLTTAMNSVHSPLKMTSVFHSVMDMLVDIVSLEYHESYSIDEKTFGLRCLIELELGYYQPNIESKNESKNLTATKLILFLAKIYEDLVLYRTRESGFDLWREFQVMRGNLPDEVKNQTTYATIDIIELDILCRPEQSSGVCSLEQICRFESTDFFVRFHGKTDQRRNGQQLFTYSFVSSQNYLYLYST